ncbi:helix-turn-helix domain-containing protein [Desulfobacterota bacterium M19]
MLPEGEKTLKKSTFHNESCLNYNYLFSPKTTLINANLGVMIKDKTVTYIYGNLPIFSHAVDDQKTFRMITSQLYINGSAKQADICRVFGVSRISVKRSVKLYREKGMAGFFEPPRRRGPAVLTPKVLQQVQSMLDNEQTIPEIAKELGLKADTLRKAVSVGKLHKPKKTRDNRVRVYNMQK